MFPSTQFLQAEIAYRQERIKQDFSRSRKAPKAQRRTAEQNARQASARSRTAARPA